MKGPRILPNQGLDTETLRVKPQKRFPKYTRLVKFLDPACIMRGMSLIFLGNPHIKNVTDFTEENLSPVVITLINKHLVFIGGT